MRKYFITAVFILCVLLLKAPISTQPAKAKEPQNVNPANSIAAQPDSTGDMDERARYIVVLHSSPLSQSMKRVRSPHRIRSSNRTASLERASRIRNHWQRIMEEQDRAEEAIRGNPWAPELEIDGYLRTILNGFVIKVHPSKLKYIESMPEVKAVYPNWPVRLHLSSSVPSIGAPDVWNMVDGSGNPVTGQGIKVGIIDSGIYYYHPDLGGCYGSGCKVAGGYDFVNNDADPVDDLDHGTHVAGIVAANGTVEGVAKDATLFAYKVVDEDGYGGIADVILALEAAADPDGNPYTEDHLDIINISLGYLAGGATGELSREVNKHANDVGMVIVNSAGNEGPAYSTITDPGYADGIITVGASNGFGYVSSYSSRGYYAHIKPDVLAPGDKIMSTQLGYGLTSMSGTSMAAPHVAGAAALLKQLYPDLTPDEIKARLMNTSLTLGVNPFIEGAGQIRVDKAATVEMMLLPGSLMLGSVDYKQDSWSSVAEFELVNASDYTRNYQLSVETLKGANNSRGRLFDVSPEQYNADLSQTSLTLDPGESTQLSISVTIQPTVLLPPERSPYVLFSSITANDGSQEIRLPFAFLYAPYPLRQLDGWPGWANGGWSSSMADLDNDGDIEVIRQAKKEVLVYHNDGTPLAGWPKSVAYDKIGRKAPVAGDIDGDGEMEVVVSSGYKNITAFNHDGTIVSGWPIQLEQNGHYPMLADLDADGFPEVVVTAPDTSYYYSWIYAFRGNGTPFPGWPAPITEHGNHSAPLAVDLNGDRHTDIVWRVGRRLYAFRHDRNYVKGWPVALGSDYPRYGAAPSAGDIDNDGDIEVIMPYDASFITALHHDGSEVEGWPIQVRELYYGDHISVPALGDLDEDGDLEIVVTANPDYTAYAFHHDGSLVSGWPVTLQDGSGNGDPIIGDIDGDGDQEILFVATEISSDLPGLYAYHHDGSAVQGFPIRGRFTGNPTLGDLDQDGYTDILVGGENDTDWEYYAGMLYAFDLTGSYKPSNIDWGSWRHDLWGTGNFHHGSFRITQIIEDRLRRSGAGRRRQVFR